jgi:hypothetical protein
VIGCCGGILNAKLCCVVILGSSLNLVRYTQRLLQRLVGTMLLSCCCFCAALMLLSAFYVLIALVPLSGSNCSTPVLPGPGSIVSRIQHSLVLQDALCL